MGLTGPWGLFRQGWSSWTPSSAPYMQARAAASSTWRTLTCPTTKVLTKAAKSACTLPTSRKRFRESNQQVGTPRKRVPGFPFCQTGGRSARTAVMEALACKRCLGWNIIGLAAWANPGLSFKTTLGLLCPYPGLASRTSSCLVHPWAFLQNQVLGLHKNQNDLAS